MFEKQKKDRVINNLIIFKGVLFGFLTMLILTALMALFSGFFFRLGTANLNIVFLLMNFIILSIIGFYVARNVERNGWLNGGIAGLIYMIVLIFIGSINIPISLVNILIMAVIGLFVGSIGGILGINL